MNKKAVCFSRQGIETIRKMNRACLERGMEPAGAYVCMEGAAAPEGFEKVTQGVREWTRSHFGPGSALIFVGAAGIAVRALSELPSDKLSDSPVIVIDDNGRYVIPILSGHAGGANKLACVLADLLGAESILTTSTDVNDAFSADTFAAENRLAIADRKGIRKVSAKALEGKSITLSIRDYPPQEKVDIVVADETDAEYSLLLRPKRYTVGLGMKKGKGAEELERFFLETLGEAGIGTDDVYALCTISLKEQEPALTALRDRYRIPVLAFDSALLQKAQGAFTASEYVRQITGVDNVCERAAVMGAGGSAELVLKKQARDGMTIAVARRRTAVLPAFS